jgi:hypothetical protein
VDARRLHVLRQYVSRGASTCEQQPSVRRQQHGAVGGAGMVTGAATTGGGLWRAASAGSYDS